MLRQFCGKDPENLECSCANISLGYLLQLLKFVVPRLAAWHLGTFHACCQGDCFPFQQIVS